MKKLILAVVVLGSVSQAQPSTLMSKSFVSEVVRSAAPFIDISNIDQELISQAYMELDEAMDQHELSSDLKILRRMIKAYNNTTSELPRLMPMRLMSRCLKHFERSFFSELEEMPSVAKLIGEMVKADAFVLNEDLDTLLDDYPTYFLYLTQNVYRHMFPNLEDTDGDPGLAPRYPVLDTHG